MSGMTFCAHGPQSLLLRTPLAVADPIFITRLRHVESSAEQVSITMDDETGQYRAVLLVSPGEQGICFTAEINGPESLWLAEWTLYGLECDEIIVPALGGQSVNRRMPAGTVLSFKYPFWWNAQFVVGMRGGEGFCLRSTESAPRLKLLRVAREGSTFALTYGFEAEGPLRQRTLRAQWYLDCFEGGWEVPVEIHRRWLERTFEAKPWGERGRFPEWLRAINFVLEIWGMAKDRPAPLHTFEQMVARIRQWTNLHSPGKTLLYLPGFANHGIDSHAPDYHPSKYLGGPEGFRRLMEVAHNLGYRVMIHTNALAMSYSQPLFRKFGRHQVVDVFGRPLGWGLDIDGDWLAEPYFAYLNPGVRAWGDLMEETLGELISDYQVDGIFLD